MDSPVVRTGRLWSSLRSPTGWDEEDLETPLGTDEQQEYTNNFTATYKISFRPFDFGSDGLLGKLVRDCERWTNTVVKMDAVPFSFFQEK